MQHGRLIIRPATDRDLPDLGRLGAALVHRHHRFDPARFISPAHPEATYAEFLRARMNEPDAVVLVAERDGRTLGYAFASIEPASMKELRATAGFIHDLFVDESARGASIGTQLAKAALSWLRDHGAARFMLWSAEGNVDAQRLFERIGFRRTMVEMTLDV